jgi:hypothetical protein
LSERFLGWTNSPKSYEQDGSPNPEPDKSMNETQKKTVYIAWTNTDLTEGRGVEYPLAVCALQATAHRLGRGKYVQGTDCRVTMEEVTLRGFHWTGPVLLVQPSEADEAIERADQERHKAKQLIEAAKEKARAAGLTEDEINALTA